MIGDHRVLAGENRAQVEQDAGLFDAGNDGRIGLAEAAAKVVGAQVTMGQGDQAGGKNSGGRRAASDHGFAVAEFDPQE